ncbi:hypothetical protein M2150_002849 [Lachnospiraceae bacterium PM6-15]|uniref:hypothetical protein n=1 Tax=Ohessyouella blattaphilus TaxID=2949333 RepID=UPI003E2AF5FF
MRALKRGLIVVLVLAITMAMMGCTKKEDVKEEEYFADEDFMKDLAKGLESRWDFQEQSNFDVADYYTEKHAEYFEGCVDSELDVISKYKDEKFENDKLKEKAISYINVLSDQKESLKYVTVSSEKFDQEWEKVYTERTKMLEVFVTDYDLTVNEKHQKTLDELMLKGELAREDDELKNAMSEMVAGLQFDVVDDGFGFKTCTSQIQNTAGVNFKSISLVINLLDANSTIVDTQYTFLNNLGNGQSAVVEFFTEKEFTSTDIVVDYWEVQE